MFETKGEKAMLDAPTSLTTAAEIELTEDERQPCEVWTRVMGYHRPVASFNIGKQAEHAERRSFVFADAKL
jgi:hypothetical protein